jgi:GT2 family glycosyltransferase
MSSKTYTIIIPNWNGKKLLEKNLPSIVALLSPHHIIIVDDHSSDDSVKFIRATYPKIQVIQKNIHEGFSSTINRGVVKAKTEIVILLNTDIKPYKNFLQPLLIHFSNPSVFAVGCLERAVINGKSYLHGRGKAHWEWGMYKNSFGATKNADTAWVSGGSGAFRTSIWKRLGGLDPLFDPFYWEDVDLCYRAKKAGYTILFEPKSKVTHYHDWGSILTNYSPWYIRRIIVRNKYIFVWKNITDPIIIGIHVVSIPLRLIKACIRLDTAHIAGFLNALANLPSILRKRYALEKIWKIFDKDLSVN